VEATEFLAQHASSNFTWEELPIILSDGRRMLLRDARHDVQAVVVPENYDPETGWQHIWQKPSDRKHLVWLARVYLKETITRLIADGAIEEYPPPRKYPQTQCHRTVTEVNEYYLRPNPEPINGKALVSWLRARRHERTAWPTGTDSQHFEGETHSIDWACHKTYYQKDGSTYLFRTGHYQFKCEASSFLEWLRDTPWLPTTKGPVCPSQAFLAKQGTKEVLGDTVPYFEGDLPADIQSLLKIQSDITVEGLLALLKDISRNADADQGLTERIYAQLHARTRNYDAYNVLTRFANEALILAKDSQQKAQWRKSGECIWEDAPVILGDEFAYLKGQYPELERFFVDRVCVKRRVDPECYVRRWLALQEAPLPDVKQRLVLVEQLYAAIKPIALQPKADRAAWWHNFAPNLKVYTQSDTFQPPSKVIFPDDGVYREMFRGRVAYAWYPTEDGFNDWAPFYQALGTALLSEVVTEHLNGDVEEGEPLPRNRFVTEAAIKMIAAWLREKRDDGYDYERFLKDGLARLVAIRETRVSSDINIEFRLEVGTIKASSSESYPVFWNRADGTLIYNNKVRKGEVAKAIAKGLLGNHRYKDFADWVELVLEAEDTQRLKNKDWSVPQPILDLFKDRAPTPEVPAPPAPSATPPQPTEGTPAISADQPAHAPTPGGQPTNPPNISMTPPKASPPLSNQTPKHGQPPQTSPDKVKDDDSDRFSFPDELHKVFNRGGATSFDDEELESHDAAGVVKDPAGRGRKLKAGNQEAIDNEPPPEERRRVTERSILEGPNESVRQDLLEWYHGKCQICGKTWPERNGRPYFTAAYLVERNKKGWVDNPGNAICLCAEHFAQWRHAAKATTDDVVRQVRRLRLIAEGGDGDLRIRFTMLKKEHFITYNEKHLLALRALIEAASEMGR
jgi:hypothetical protein